MSSLASCLTPKEAADEKDKALLLALPPGVDLFLNSNCCLGKISS